MARLNTLGSGNIGNSDTSINPESNVYFDFKAHSNLSANQESIDFSYIKEAFDFSPLITTV